ncbi:PREDICTED: peroxisome biogenesis factor 13 isoform X2 [Nanorana parkeri]|uniref:peroxisome biogenesis factor 13 isoform X2 n=1 Tax=Nanorana parkeri TaxID=125878 RepID=UPI000854EB00|nr:PREDICTED: peroxisome biogenesis factor 13 isoform X2 [Nanorana parkeri]
MAAQPAPPKPWETRRVLGGLPATSYQSADLRASTLTRPGQPALTRVPPPVLPRPSQQTRTSSLNTYRPAYSSFSPGYGSYGSYGSSLYGGHSPYSYGYGNALGYNRFQTDEASPSRFVRQAEESSRGAFQSIESIVQAFASVSMMMDATFSAVYNSFRAVLDVANHFSRLRVHFTKVFSAFALVRTIRFLYRRLQRLLGLRKGSENEDLWSESAGNVARLGAENDATQSAKSWPIFLFFAVILGGPYLIWKLLSSGNAEMTKNMNWASGEGDHVVGRAEYDFIATSDEEISFHAGDMLNLAPKEQQPNLRGWLLGSVDGQTTGFVPANYIKILGKRRGRKAEEAEKRPEQEAFPNDPSLGAASSVATLEDQDAALESVFVDTSSTGHGVETSTSHRDTFDL